MEFRIYSLSTGGTALWTEAWTGANAVQVSDGLFNVMLGSINNTLAAAISGNNELYLGIKVGADSEMIPRVQLGSAPFAMQALTVPDNSITTAKIADGAVTQAKAPIFVKSPDNNTRIEYGAGAWSDPWTQVPAEGVWHRCTMVNFAEPFASAPKVFVTSSSYYQSGDWGKVTLINVDGASICQVALMDLGAESETFSWLAIGQ